MGRICENLTGSVFGKLTVIQRDINLKNGKICWICKCDCGNIISVRGPSLKDGETKSCGCNKQSYLRKHGDSGSYFYGLWKGIKSRCLNPNHEAFKHYGGRGILLCEHWQIYENFKEDMYNSYLTHINQLGRKDTTIERINNNGNYELSNCKWATRNEQMKNTRVYISSHLLPTLIQIQCDQIVKRIL